ncbi:MAG: hypothetical protein ACOX6T_04655 [Myxococcales bacterium]
MRSLIIAACLVALVPGFALAGEPEQAPKPSESPSRLQAEREAVEDDGYEVRLSLPTEDDRAAWLQPGLRVELAIEYGVLLPHGPAPRIGGFTAHVRPRLRIDELWSIAATFGYTVVRGDYQGVRWSAVVEPIFHPIPSLGISLALGYGGLSVTRTSGSFPVGSSTETGSRTLSDGERLYACSGGGWVSQARVEYLAVVGPLFSTGPYLVADGQWTGCEQSFGKIDRETGEQAMGRQWWLSLGGAIGWWLSWR